MNSDFCALLIISFFHKYSYYFNPTQNGVLEHFSVGDDIEMEVRLELSLILELTFMDDTRNKRIQFRPILDQYM